MQPEESPRGSAIATARAGQLTAVMRAAQTPSDAAANVPLVLRVGVVRAGRIVEERVFARRERSAVSIGTSEDATFICGASTRPPRFELFARRKDGYALRFDAAMSGRVALANEVVTLEALRARTSPKGGVYEIALPEEARGKIVAGETTFLFQFVRPPPPSPRPQLPLAVKGGFASQIDWSLTIIAALSFLLHFGIVGAMYSDWMDVVVDDHRSVAGLVDLVKNIPSPPVETTPAETPSEAEPTTASTPEAKTTSTTASSSKATSKSSSRMSDREAAALDAQATRLELDLLAASTGKTATEAALRRSNLPPVDLSARAASNEGVAHGGSELHLPSGGPAVAARNPGGLADLAGDTRRTANANAGDTRTVAAPKVDAQIGALGGGVTVTGADRVIAGLRGRFRTCYQKGLSVDPTMSGKVVIRATIAPNGEVSGADVASSSGLSPEVGACIASAVHRAQFDPQATATTLSIPVSFVKQN